MFNKQRLLVSYLIVSLFTVTVFGQGSQASPNPTPDTQIVEITDSAETSSIPMTTLGTESPSNEVYAILEEGTQGNDQLFYQEKQAGNQRAVFGGFNKKKIAALTAAAGILSGVAYLAVVSANWSEAANCKTIYYPASKICSFDRGELIKYNPGEPQRGMYLSLWTEEVMRLSENQKYANILGDNEKEQQVLDFIDRHHIDALSLYNLGVIFDTQGMAEMLSTFIIKAKNHGIKEIIGIGHDKRSFSIIEDFHKRYPGRIDALITEQEFWNNKVDKDKAFAELIDLLKYMKGLGLKNSVSNKDVKIATYFGVLNRLTMSESEVAKATILNTDRIYQHCYGTAETNSTHDPADAYADCKAKVAVWLQVKKEMGRDVQSPPIVPIYSAEGKKFYSIHGLPIEYYAGDWFQAHKSIDAFEEEVRAEIKGFHDPDLLSGSHYYEYMYLDYYLSRAGNVTTPKTVTPPKTAS